jgi:hypothetical protein
MEFLFHLVFEIFKIGILASIYAAVLLLIFLLIANLRSASWLARTSKNKSKFLIRTSFIIATVLFCYMFTYWGSHGLGDSSRIPLGYDKSVKQIDSWTYIEPAGFEFETLQIAQFATNNNFLFAKRATDKNSHTDSAYLAWNLETNKVDFFNDYSNISRFAKANGIRQSIEFQDFGRNYKYYWGGWRFWLLP